MFERWHNYVTEQYEWLIKQPADLHPYIPQDRDTQELFDAYVYVYNMIPIEAMIKVLRGKDAKSTRSNRM